MSMHWHVDQMYACDTVSSKEIKLQLGGMLFRPTAYWWCRSLERRWRQDKSCAQV